MPTEKSKVTAQNIIDAGTPFLPKRVFTMLALRKLLLRPAVIVP